MNEKLIALYGYLFKKHGQPLGQWSLWCKRAKTIEDREEVAIGAILTQNTNWRNVLKAVENLRQAGYLSLSAIRDLGQSDLRELARLIKPAGFYNSKSKYLFALSEYVVRGEGMEKIAQRDPEKVRNELLALKGVGKETADSILLYGLHKPIFVIDEFTRRICRREDICDERDYDKLQNIFQNYLNEDVAFFQDFHALIVIEKPARL
jgi:endonuclease III related protein